MQQQEQKNLFSRLHFHRKTNTICRLASAVTVGNRILADYARQFNSSVHVVPSTIELDEYPVIPEPADQSKFIVCWTGSSTTLVHFEQARDALERLATRVPLVVKIICSKPPERPIAGAEMRFVRWSAEGEAQEVGACHAGIMPLPDNKFCRGKCSMKALQFMATGRPVVLSPVGANVDLVRDGDNAFLARTAAEFTDKLGALAASAELRATVGTAARKTVEAGYSAAMGAEKFASVVRSITHPSTG
jgi:glycosyltransferase involved in cell wall biosynthesis